MTPVGGGLDGIFIGRRQFITALGGAASWPLAARAQQPALPVVGFLNSGSSEGYAPMVGAFREGLKATGYVDGQNVAIEYHWAEGQYDRLPAMVSELVAHKVAVIVANTPANLTAKKATATIPIVFTTGGDPVQLGLVASLNQPGGNVTGTTQLNGEVASKRVELAHQLVPAATVIGLIVNSGGGSEAETVTRDSLAAAISLGVKLNVLRASTDAELDDAFTTFSKTRVGVVVISNDAFFSGRAEQLAALAIRHSMPAVFQYRRFAAAGGLASYGVALPTRTIGPVSIPVAF